MQKFILKYVSGEFVQRDDSTGFMSSGGYPYPVGTIDQATMWDSAAEAAQYASVCNWDRMERKVYEVKFEVGDFIAFPQRGLWTECNHHCVKDLQSNSTGALHYLDCAIRKS